MPARRRGLRQFRRGLMIDAVVALQCGRAIGMGDAGEMDDNVHAGEQRRPVERRREIGKRHRLDVGSARHLLDVARGGAHVDPGIRQRRRQRPADEARCAGDEDAGHGRGRLKVTSSQVTLSTPRASAAKAAKRVWIRLAASASATSATLTTKTRVTISMTL